MFDRTSNPKIDYIKTQLDAVERKYNDMQSKLAHQKSENHTMIERKRQDLLQKIEDEKRKLERDFNSYVESLERGVTKMEQDIEHYKKEIEGLKRKLEHEEQEQDRLEAKALKEKAANDNFAPRSPEKGGTARRGL